jgi:hypothetical protein
MKEKAWRFQLDLIGYGDDPGEAWSNLLLYSLKEPPPCERVPEQDVDPEDEEEEQGAKKVDVAIYLFMEAAFDVREPDVSRKGIREYASQMARHLRHVADLAGVLQRDGWSLKVVRNYLVGTHPDVKSAEDATNRLIRLGILDDVYDVGEWDRRGKRLNAF